MNTPPCCFLHHIPAPQPSLQGIPLETQDAQERAQHSWVESPVKEGDFGSCMTVLWANMQKENLGSLIKYHPT